MKFLCLFSLFLFSCTQKEENIIYSSLESEIITIDPHKAYDMTSNLVVYQLYEALYQYQYLKRPYTVEPLLAKSLPQVSDNGLIYTIEIKKNIPYHNWEKFSKDKRFVTSYDFINGIKRLAFQGTDSKGWWLLQGKIKGLDQFRKKVATNLELFESENVEGLVPLSDHIFQIKLTKPYPQLTHVLTMSFTAPMPFQIIKKYNNSLEDEEFGTGAYTLSEIDKTSFVKMDKFEQYQSSKYPPSGDRKAYNSNHLKSANKKLPLNNGLRFKVIKDEQKTWQSFLKKEIDFLDIPPDIMDVAINLNGKLKSSLKKKNIQVEVSPSLVFWWLGINMNDPILGSNLNLRKAIAHSINMKSYVNNFYSNIGMLANSIYPPGVPGHNPLKTWPYNYDIKKAKDFLKKAGYPEGKNLPVIEFNTRRESERHLLMAKFIQKELSKIGLTVKIVVNNFSTFLSKARKSQMQFWSSGWLMDYPDPQNILQLLYSKNGNGGPNKTSFSNARFDKLYKKYQSTNDQAERESILEDLEKIIVSEVPWLITNYSINYVVRKDNLKNLRYSDLIFNFFKYLEKK